MGKIKDNFVIDGRLSYHFIPKSIKLFLDVEPKVGAERIRLDKRKEEKFKTNKLALRFWKERLNSDIKRYKKYYKLTPYQKNKCHHTLKGVVCDRHLFLGCSEMKTGKKLTTTS